MEADFLRKSYILLRKIGSGGYGEIYKALNVVNNQKVAIKCEYSSNHRDVLYQEYKIYNYLAKIDKNYYFPLVHEYFTDKGCNYMVMELLGKSVSDIFKQQNKKLSLKSVLIIGQLMLSKLEFLHNNNYIHRDIKPNNFVFGVDDKQKELYLIDYGFTKKLIINGNHIPYKENRDFKGTYRYSSLNSHLGIEQSRRDDLESLAYVLIYLLKGSLPWQNVRIKDKTEKIKKIKKIKAETSSEKLCEKLPEEFLNILKYSKKLEFDEKPDYEFLKKCLMNCMVKFGYEFDSQFCWEK